MPVVFGGRRLEAPWTVISLEALRPPVIQGVDRLAGITPGAPFAKENGFGPFMGISRIILFWITVETLDVDVESCAVSAWTSTLALSSPTFRGISSEMVCCTSSRTLLVTYC